MERKEVIWEYQKAINAVYDEEDLHCLRGDNDDYLLKDKQILMWYSTVTRKCVIKYPGKFETFKNFDELMLFSDEVMHYTAKLYLYRPFINSPIKHSFQHADKTIFPNYQNVFAKRYYMYSDIVCEKVYSFWDRIGALIAAFFPELINPERVFFSSAFDIIPSEYHSLDSYKWLKNFRDTSYKEVNDKRREIVHYTSSDTNIKYQHLLAVGTRSEIDKWIDERHKIPDFFKEHSKYILEGFYQTITLLEEVDKILFSDVNLE